MRVNLKMNPTLETPVTFTDEEEISKPRLGINYEGHKLYTPMGLGWYDNNKKGLYSNLYTRSLAALWGVDHRGEEQYGILIQVNPNTVGVIVTISDGTSYTFNTSSEIQTLYIEPSEDESVKTITIKDLYNYKSVNYTVPKEDFKTLIMYNSSSKVSIATLRVYLLAANSGNWLYVGDLNNRIAANYKGTASVTYSNGDYYPTSYDRTVTSYVPIWEVYLDWPVNPSYGNVNMVITCGGKEYLVNFSGSPSETGVIETTRDISITDYTFEIEEGE